MIQAIFFDFNGVIIDDEPVQMAVYQEVLRGHGIELTEVDYYDTLGVNDEGLVRFAFERAQKTLTDDVLKKVIEEKGVRHRQLIAEELPLFPGVVTFLKATARHYSLGLVSMATRDEIGYVLGRARLSSLFLVIVSAENVGVTKPASDCYVAALKKLNEKRREERLLPLLPRECLVIEDSPPGIESGRTAGMRTLGITNTVSEQQLRAAGAEVVSFCLVDWGIEAVARVFD
ncbi:MAG TPA: HAD family phosphatase [Pyrinomonadaceae bacterium]|jgi:phosphoglycolate phosphatase/beta-phosphoglucomutase|nr:HAD family phosphatase [Pyrinomonadaceae bacterium]